MSEFSGLEYRYRRNLFPSQEEYDAFLKDLAEFEALIMEASDEDLPPGADPLRKLAPKLQSKLQSLSKQAEEAGHQVAQGYWTSLMHIRSVKDQELAAAERVRAALGGDRYHRGQAKAEAPASWRQDPVKFVKLRAAAIEASARDLHARAQEAKGVLLAMRELPLYSRRQQVDYSGTRTFEVLGFNVQVWRTSRTPKPPESFSPTKAPVDVVFAHLVEMLEVSLITDIYLMPESPYTAADWIAVEPKRLELPWRPEPWNPPQRLPNESDLLTSLKSTELSENFSRICHKYLDVPGTIGRVRAFRKAVKEFRAALDKLELKAEGVLQELVEAKTLTDGMVLFYPSAEPFDLGIFTTNTTPENIFR